jgi:hypothetical protein
MPDTSAAATSINDKNRTILCLKNFICLPFLAFYSVMIIRSIRGGHDDTRTVQQFAD